MNKVVGFIAARGGSHGIPGKNIKDFCGKPLIAWAIEASRGARFVQRTLVSTDSSEIAGVARKFGAETPFLRPQDLATSEIGIEPAIRHAIAYLKENENYVPDYVCLLPATNPLKSSEIIDHCIRVAVEGKYECVMTVNEVPANHTPFWSLVERNGKPAFYYEKDLKSRFARRQDFPEKCFARNDLVYVFRPDNLFALEPTLYGTGNKVKLVKTPSYYDGDINTPEEWLITENLFRFLRSPEGQKLKFLASDED